MEYDGHSRMQSLIAVDITIGTSAPTIGNVIDTVDFESLEFTFLMGPWFFGDFDILLEESDTGAFGGEENIVVLDDLIGTPTTLSADDTLTRVGYIGKKQFCRSTILGTSGANACVAVIATLGRPRSMPVADQ